MAVILLRVFSRERLFPRALRGGLAVFGGAGFEEVGVLGAIQHFIHPWQRIFRHTIDRLQAKLRQATIGNVTDI